LTAAVLARPTSILRKLEWLGGFARAVEDGEMKLVSMRMIRGAAGTALACALGLALASGQTAPAPKPKPATTPAAAGAQAKAPGAQMSDVVFKNVQALKGIPVDEFMGTMGFLAASLSLNCTDCHISESASSWPRYADDTPIKITARKMIFMVNAINKANFGGSKFVTCWTCHRGNQRPTVIPSLLEQYSPPPPDDPNEVTVNLDAYQGPTVDQILDKYLQALGGPQKVAAMTSVVAKGMYMGYDTDFSPVDLDIYVKAPDLKSTVIHMIAGDSVTTFDGKNGWIASPDKPIPLMDMSGGTLDGAKVDASVFFPANIKQMLTNYKPAVASIDDKMVAVVTGTSGARLPVKLYFDPESGLLLREVRYIPTMVGTNPLQIDFADYRDVNGFKFPFHWVTTWTDGQSTTDLSSVQINTTIAAKQFNKPAPAKTQ
jgi:photosynthetic reaction center cytochrome c subunit